MAKQNLNLKRLPGLILVLIFVIFSLSGLSMFEEMERALLDNNMRLTFSGQKGAHNIVLLEIDGKSLQRIGPWPWPRLVMAEMIKSLNQEGVRLICLNLPFSAEEQNQGLSEVRAFRDKFGARGFEKENVPMTKWVMENLAQLEEKLDSDRQMAASALLSGKVILPVFENLGYGQKKMKREEDLILSKNLLMQGKSTISLNGVDHLSSISLPFTDLAQNVLGLGHGKSMSEGMMGSRSHPVFIRYKSSLLPSFPLRAAIAYLNQKPRQVIVDKNLIRLKDRTIPIIDGEMLVRFYNDLYNFPRYSFSDILQAKKIPPIFKNKIVLIGFNNKDSKSIPTPISPSMSENELIARILHNTINKNFIFRPPYLVYIETLVLLCLGVLASYLFPRLGWLRRLGWMLGLTILILLSGTLFLVMMDAWFKTVYIVACLITIYMVVSINQYVTSERDTKESIEINRLLGLSFQSQGLLDLAYEKFQKLPLDLETRKIIFQLGLEYERKRMINKALTVYEYINEKGGFGDLEHRIPKLMESSKSSTIGSHGRFKEASIVEESSPEERKKVGRYELLEVLGSGSMGLVYKALDPKINRHLAIKTIRFSDEFEDDAIKDIKRRFLREAEIAGQLAHPSIVTIYDVGEDEDLTYIVMEYLEGKDLSKFIKRKNLLSFRKILQVIALVADALEYAHTREVIHRDIKPANIMLLDNGGVKMTDFGIAKAISSSRTKTGVILGTPNYMSPEQIMGQKIDQKSDIFSLGVLFYQLLSGKLPFQGKNLSSLLYQITQVKHPPVRDFNARLPKVCSQIIDKALSKERDDRFKSAGEMAKVIRLLSSKINQMMRRDAFREESFSEA
jgi:serine/threonine-protein kinase